MAGRARRAPGTILVALGLSLSLACSTDDPNPDLLAQLLQGRLPILQSYYSYAGAGNAGGTLQQVLVSTINLSRSSIYCSFHDVNLPAVLDALHLAYLRNVDVRVGIDEDYQTGIGYDVLAQYLTTTGTGTNRRLWVGNSGSGEVYMNICVSDRTRVFASTAAPTLEEMFHQNAYAIYLQSDENEGIATKFNTVLDVITHGSFGSSKQRLSRRNHWLVGGLDVGIYFAPEEDPLEGFLMPRLPDTTDAILMYSSEFFSNELDSSDIREASDLAYEINASRAPVKQVVSSWYSYVTSDPDASLGLNSMQYLNANGGAGLLVHANPWPTGGMSFVIMNPNGPGRMTFASSHPYGARTDSSHDGFTFIFEDIRFAGEFMGFYSGLVSRSVSVPTNTGTDYATANNREVVISELNWMGGYNDDGSGRTGSYVELYNNTGGTINLSGWRLRCTNSGGTNTMVTIPNQTLIGPEQYLLLQEDTNPLAIVAHRTVNWTTTLTGLSGIQTCQLEDPDATIIDIVGDAGQSFGLNENAFGVNDTTNRIRRSMERTTLTGDGSSSNFHTNSNASWATNFNVRGGNNDKTFGTPGLPNSANVATSQLLQGVIMNEICVNNASCAGGSDYVELYNTTSRDIDLSAARAYIQNDTSCDLTNGVNNKNAVSGTIPAGGYLVFNNGGANFIVNSHCVALTIGSEDILSHSSANIVDFVSFVAGTPAVPASHRTTITNKTSRCPNGTGQYGQNWIAERPDSSGAANDCPAAQATVLISEVAAANNCGVDGQDTDFIELYVTAGGSMGGWEVREHGSSSGTLLYTFDNAFSVTTGDVIIVHTDSGTKTGEVNEDVGGTRNDSPTTTTCSTGPHGVNGVWDVYSADTGFTATDNCFFLRNGLNAIVDAVCFSNMDGDATSTMMGVFTDYYDDHAPQNADTTPIDSDMWAFTTLPADGGNDATIQGMCVNWNGLAGGNSLKRNGTTDTNAASDWSASGAQNPGTHP